MTYPHELRGSCVPDCPRYGFCHCSPTCEARPRTPKHNQPRRGYVAGRPHVFAAGHNPRQCTGCWGRRGVARERLQPIVTWMRDTYGYEVARGMLGLDPKLYHWLLIGRPGTVSPKRAARMLRLARYHGCTVPLLPILRAKLPVAPLLEAIALRCARVPGLSARALGDDMAQAIHRATVAGWVTVEAGDEIATALGIHPTDVWGDAWVAA